MEDGKGLREIGEGLVVLVAVMILVGKSKDYFMEGGGGGGRRKLGRRRAERKE